MMHLRGRAFRGQDTRPEVRLAAQPNEGVKVGSRSCLVV